MMALRACAVLRTSNKIINKDLLASVRPSAVYVRCLHGPPRQNEYSDVSLYPSIPQHKDHREANISRTKKKIAQLGTVEEKQFFLNQPKYYGWYSYRLSDTFIPPDSREFLQFATQTHVLHDMPDYYKEKDSQAEKILDQISIDIEKVILNHYLHSQREYEVCNDRVPFQEVGAVYWEDAKPLLEKKKGDTLVKNIHQAVMARLMSSRLHLKDCSEDFDSRNEAFWFRGGVDPDVAMLKKREGTQKMQKAMRKKGYKYPSEDGLRRVITDEEVKQPYERAIQYTGSHTLQLRSDLPLPPFVSRESELVTQSEVPVVSYDPRVWGYKAKCRHGTNVPGYWPDVTNQHGLLFLQPRLNSYQHQAMASGGVLEEEKVEREVITGKAIQACFSWLLAQATHLGFSPMTELTFPLATQGAITDGQTWSYCAYQLNTIDLTTNNPEEARHNNILWLQERDEKLFDRVEDGKIINYRPEALAPLVKMYLRQPQARDYSLTPYLSQDRTVANFHEPYQRNSLHNKHRHMYANRPRHYEKPEMYLWEKIHLVDHPGVKAHLIGSRRKRWFQMYKVHHWGREHWHPEFEAYEEKNNPYLPKAYRAEDYMKKKGLGRRYNKHLPKLSIPLEDKAAVYKLPKSLVYEKPED